MEQNWLDFLQDRNKPKANVEDPRTAKAAKQNQSLHCEVVTCGDAGG
jgi:hypothetical protein